MSRQQNEISWSYNFSHPVEAIWKIISDTDRLNQAVGLPSVRFNTVGQSQGGSKRFAGGRINGFKFQWEEMPFEWVKNSYLEVERRYSSGPLELMITGWEVSPTPQGCQVRQTIRFVPRFRFLTAFIQLGFKTIEKFRFFSFYKKIESLLEDLPTKSNTSLFPQILLKHTGVSSSIPEKIRLRLAPYSLDPSLTELLTKYLANAPDTDLVKLRPFALAKIWKINKLDILKLFLFSTKAGVLNLSWEILCPGCRGASLRSNQLSHITQNAHCDSCNLSYTAEFDKSVELAFTVNPEIRKIIVNQYCVGGPASTSHILVQQRIPAHTTKKFELPLQQGSYRLRSLQSPQALFVQVADASVPPSNQSPQVYSFVPSPTIHRTDLTVASGRNAFEITNSCDVEILGIFERTEWLDDACTAAYVTSLQEFRDLFSSEVLRPGQEISVQSMALIFTDLKGSTAMYNRIGDATAFSLVREHFDILIECIKQNEGGLVKTIGDAVMAAFTSPEKAILTAIEIHKKIEENNRRKNLTHPIKLKIGIHFGPCFVVNLNDRLDYFGSTANIAARTEGQCMGGDIVISARMMEDPQVRQVIEKSGHPVQKIVRTLKGFEDQFELYQIQCIS